VIYYFLIYYLYFFEQCIDAFAYTCTFFKIKSYTFLKLIFLIILHISKIIVVN